jgi:hypothetical protein
LGSGAASFRGGIHVRRFFGGAGAPAGGHLEFDRDLIRLWGLGFEVTVRREDVRAVRFGPGMLATRFSVMPNKPGPAQMFWLSTRRPTPVRAALTELGWPIVEDRKFDLGVADEIQE